MRKWMPLLWYGLIFATSSTVIWRDDFVTAVTSALPSQSAKNGFESLWQQTWWLFVKGWHATEFAILLCLVRRSVQDLGWSLFLVAIAAVLDEFHQTFVPGRGGNVTDVLIDIGGAAVAAIILAWRSAPLNSKRSTISAR